ncbi:MAG: hypothetical protein ACKPDI_13360, partial [Actinomycetota bacterium]
MTSVGRVLRCAAVAAVGFVLVPSAASAAPVDPIPADSIPVDTVPVDTVPVDTAPVDVPGEPGALPEGCAQVGDYVVCVGTPPVPYESVAGGVDAPTPEAVAAPARAGAVPVVPPAVEVAQEAPVMVASEAPVPPAGALQPAGSVTLSEVAPRSVAELPAAAAAPADPSVAGADDMPVPLWGITLLLAAVVA